MKKLKVFLASLLLVTLVTGCGMKAEYGIKVGKDKKVSLEFLVAQDNEMIDAMLNMGDSLGGSDSTKEHTDKERWEYLKSDSDDDFKDFKKEKYDKDGYKGYIYTLELGDISKLVTEDEAIEFGSIGEDSKLFTKNGDLYKLNIKVSDEDNQQMTQYGDQVKFDVTLKVTLPNKAKSNNATKVSGTTYTWDLAKVKDIKLEFDVTGKKESDNKIMIIGGICAAAAIVICSVSLAMTKKKKTA